MLLWLPWDGRSSADDAAQGAGAAEPDAAALIMQCGPGLDYQQLTTMPPRARSRWTLASQFCPAPCTPCRARRQIPGSYSTDCFRDVSQNPCAGKPYTLPSAECGVKRTCALSGSTKTSDGSWKRGLLTHFPFSSTSASPKRRRKLPWTLMPLWLPWDGLSSAADAPQGAGAAEPDTAASTMQCGPGLVYHQLARMPPRARSPWTLASHFCPRCGLSW